MNKIILTILMITLSNGFVFAQTEPLDTDGNGYRNISTIDELRWVSENDSSWSWNFELDNNINAVYTKNWNDGQGWSPIGNKTKPFQGVFEGNGFEIDSLFINRPSQINIGFLGYNVEAEIRNVGVVNCDITGLKQVGGLVGCISSSTVSTCYSTGSVEGIDYVGGLVGSNYSLSTIINSFSAISVKGDYNVGGLVGFNEISTVSNSYSTGSVMGNDHIGGLVGEHQISAVINSYSIVSVEGDYYVGGLVGFNNYSSFIINSYSTGSVSGSEQIGGLVGYNYKSTVARSFWDTQTSEQKTSAGGTGKTTDEMQTKSTFINAGWNFDFIWDISTAYPVLDIDTTYRPSDTDDDGYLNISTLTDLRWLSESGFDLDSDWELDNDINAADTKNWNGTLGFSSIGTTLSTGFSGEFEGHGYQIDSLFINRPSQSSVGFFGYIINGAEIRNIGVVNCNISGYESIGGLVGVNSESTVISCYMTGSVFGKDQVGGLAGRNYSSTVSNSYSKGSVSGSNYVGGLVGDNTTSSSIIESYSLCSVTGSNQVGGLVGSNSFSSTVSNSYSRGSVSGNDCIGGLVGCNDVSKVINSYSTGRVEGTGSFVVGGLVGLNRLSETGHYEVVYSFWDTQTSGQTTSDGGTGKSTAEMKTKSTFTDAGWDFENIWKIDGTTNDGYPYFRDVNTGILEYETIPEKNILIYPNPASDYIEITISNKGLQPFANSEELAIYDVLGNVVWKSESVVSKSTSVPINRDTSAGGGQVKIDISSLPRGVYFMRVGDRVEKFVILK